MGKVHRIGEPFKTTPSALTPIRCQFCSILGRFMPIKAKSIRILLSSEGLFFRQLLIAY
jgi:hypothetical protein